MRNPIKTAFAFVLALALAALLGACGSSTNASNGPSTSAQPSLPTEEWMPVAGQGEGQLPAGSVTIQPLSTDYASMGSTSGDVLGEPYVYTFGNCAAVDFVFLGTVQKIEPYLVNFEPTTDGLDQTSDDASSSNIAPVCDITVRIDRVFSGDGIQAGDTVVVFTSDIASMKGGDEVVTGSQLVLLADDVFTDTQWGRLDIRQSQIAMFPGLKESFGQADMWVTGSSHYYIYPVKNGFVAAPLEWAFDVKPTVALSPKDLNTLCIGVGSGGYTGIEQYAAYYSLDDFAKALAFYQDKYPMTQVTTLSEDGAAISSEKEPSSYFDPEHLSANEKKLRALQGQPDPDQASADDQTPAQEPAGGSSGIPPKIEPPEIPTAEVQAVN